MQEKPGGDAGNSVARVVLVAVSVVLQVAWLLVLFQQLYDWSPIIQSCVSLLAIVVVLYVLGREQNSAYKLLWTVVLLSLPIFGLLLFAILETSPSTHKARREFAKADAALDGTLPANEAELADLAQESPYLGNAARYLATRANAPLWRADEVTFYADAAEGYEAQLAAIAEAREFVFLEYHAIEDSASFRRMKELLARKAAEGVDVRVVYDDLGSFGFINHRFARSMEAIGVKCRAFNPMIPVLSVLMNNRDHRKITVVDGRVGFTGGYNLADEYFNITHPYGQWKDTGVRLTGGAVKSLTATFLQMWIATGDTDEGDYSRFFPNVPEPAAAEGRGWVQPYADSPLVSSPVAENVYMNVIGCATKRLWATTPYLIIDDEMTRTLTLAARRGVDVRIVTPGIPDKKLVYRITRSYYAQLARHGVRIYEWAPGFIHAKQMLADDAVACVGTINLDYRSLYLHFENGCVIYDNPALKDIEADFENVFGEAVEVTKYYANERVGALRIGRRLLRLLSPLV